VSTSVVVAIVVLGCVTFTSTAALAAQVHPFVSSFKIPGPEPVGFGVAVNESTHRLYVTNVQGGRAFQLNASGGNPVELTIPPEGAARGIAVDNSGTASDGLVYLAAGAVGVQQFSSSGSATAVLIDVADVPAAGTPQAGGLPNVVNNGQFIARAVAVDDAGTVFVFDTANLVIDEFSSTGTFVKQIASGNLTEAASLIAVSGAGDVYVAATAGLYELSSTGACVNSCASLNAEQPSFGVAVDSSTENVLVTENGGEAASDAFISEFNSAGALISRSGPEHLSSPGGIAVDASNGNIIVVNRTPLFHSLGNIFGPLITLPDATTGAATGVTGSSATLHGLVGADGGAAATCVFQYVPSAEFGESGFADASAAPCSPAGPFTGSGHTAVEAAVINLNGGTTYKYRLLATSSVGSTPGTANEFVTAGPTVEAQSVSGITQTTATFEAVVNPHNVATTYRFEFVSAKQFGEDGYANATKVPIPDGVVGSGAVGVLVSQTIGGLAPGTGYHVHVVAVSGSDVATGPDTTFVTYPPPAGLPDHRVFEQVSPINKNGANVLGETNAVHASPDGNRLTFFTTAGLAGGEGAQGFPTYLASRESQGWSTQGLLPSATTGPAGQVLGWRDDLEDVYVANRQPTGPAVLYERRSSDHALTPIVEGSQERSGYNVAAASPDGNLVLFEHSTAQLATGATINRPNVYLWDRSTGQVVVAGELNTAHAPPKGAFPGAYNWFVAGSPEVRGGTFGEYYTQSQHVLSDDGSRVFFTAGGTGQLYMRVNPLLPQSAVNGEGKCTEPAKACTIKLSTPESGVIDPNGEQPAAFVGATADGGMAFFLSSGKLTADATTGFGDEGRDLYRFDASTGDLVDLTVDVGDEVGAEVQGLLGMSEDGSYVYFAANGVLAAGAAPGNCNLNQPAGACSIYVAHGTTISFVARVEPAAGSGLMHDQFNWTPTSAPFGSGETEQAAARVTPDGQTLLFRSNRQITSYRNEGAREIYRYHVGDPGPTCISCNPTNAAPSGSADLTDPVSKGTGPRLTFAQTTRNLSSDGNRVFFETPDPLAVNDTNGVSDVYEWEAPKTGTCESNSQNGGCLYLLSSGSSELPSHFADASPSGDDAFVFTAQSLVYQDRDELVDLYDARVNGGIPSQNVPEATPCDGEAACLGSAPSQPLVAAPGTSVSGPGNPKPIKCKKGFKKVTNKGKERCVKIKRKHSKKSSTGKKKGARR
jgi:hypothetical protein